MITKRFSEDQIKRLLMVMSEERARNFARDYLVQQFYDPEAECVRRRFRMPHGGAQLFKIIDFLHWHEPTPDQGEVDDASEANPTPGGRASEN